ncbi:ComEA family DNA-binding protein [Stenotrophomonas sp. HITSZ_GD]|uniref:ComEA family DNA-binding protein n=1 Tax=Stenotrophomonas sp. HITSZ_GD TaxID=3037248 RepID=UPI00240E62CC|nr:ComEA family DNA-binding protein [Stenotrophomonas sp. HITSZ_GD]MDG2525522.1 ComEA family DNA-binding protein [Stenotrophomonas sp. HITSZ_GD]
MKSFAVAVRALAFGLLLSIPAMAGAKVDINSASAEELDQVLVNVGPSKAKAIVEHREAHGPFKSAEDLAQVKGIGLSTVERNRDLIEVGAGSAPGKAPVKAQETATSAPAEPVTRQ